MFEVHGIGSSFLWFQSGQGVDFTVTVAALSDVWRKKQLWWNSTGGYGENNVFQESNCAFLEKADTDEFVVLNHESLELSPCGPDIGPAFQLQL